MQRTYWKTTNNNKEMHGDSALCDHSGTVDQTLENHHNTMLTTVLPVIFQTAVSGMLHGFIRFVPYKSNNTPLKKSSESAIYYKIHLVRLPFDMSAHFQNYFIHHKLQHEI